MRALTYAIVISYSSNDKKFSHSFGEEGIQMGPRVILSVTVRAENLCIIFIILIFFIFFSILGRIVRVTNEVVEYRQFIEQNFPLSKSCASRGVPDDDNEEELESDESPAESPTPSHDQTEEHHEPQGYK